MPNRWESSARPLFVKTVFVNGNRHAILFEKDPLLHCVDSPVKKSSRPSSSLSYASSLTISSSEESQKTSSDCKSFKFRNIGRSHGKDLSSELQGCLVKFKLASGSVKDKNKSIEEKCFCDLKGREENSRQKTPKGNRDKSGKRCQHIVEERNEYKLAERKTSRDKGCYIYNLENYNRRKNYSFVKITSQSPQFLLNCGCENEWNETHNPRNKNSLVISASIQNLVMTPNENENFQEKTLNYVLPLENSDLNWNNYLTKSCYNSLAERVFQWLDLARKRKKSQEKLDSSEAVCDTSTERIYSGKKFADEIKRNENVAKTKNCFKKNGKLLQSDTSEEEIEEKVIREQNVETLLSQECSQKTSLSGKHMGDAVADVVDNTKHLGKSSEETLIYNLIKTPLKIQDLFLNSPTIEIKNPRDGSSRNTEAEIRSAEEESSGGDNRDKLIQCYCNRSLDKYGNDINSQTLTEEFAERNQKSINNLNITRSRPVLIQNLSPQQHDNISSLEEEKVVWASEKRTGRPQLHIFMPSVLLKDQSDDSLSECETSHNL